MLARCPASGCNPVGAFAPDWRFTIGSNRLYIVLAGCCLLLPVATFVYLAFPGLRQVTLDQVLRLALLLVIPAALNLFAIAVAWPLRWLQFVAAGLALWLDIGALAVAAQGAAGQPLDVFRWSEGLLMLYVFWVFLAAALAVVVAVLSALISGALGKLD